MRAPAKRLGREIAPMGSNPIPSAANPLFSYKIGFYPASLPLLVPLLEWAISLKNQVAHGWFALSLTVLCHTRPKSSTTALQTAGAGSGRITTFTSAPPTFRMGAGMLRSLTSAQIPLLKIRDVG